MLNGKLGHEVAIVLSTIAAILVVVNQQVLDIGPTAHQIINVVLIVLAGIGIRANVTPVVSAGVKK